MSPTNSRSCAAISNTEAPMPAAKIVIIRAAASRASLCTIAIAHPRADPLPKKARPFDRIDWRPADDDALEARVERVADRRRDLALRDALTVAVRRQAQRELQRVRQEMRREPERGALMHHHRPFFVDGFPDVLPDQPAQSVARFRGKLGRQHDGGPERAGS